MINKTTIVLGLALLSIAGFTLARPGHGPEPMDKQVLIQKNSADGPSKSWSATMPASAAKHVRIELQIGDVQVSTGNSSDVKADFTKKIGKDSGADDKAWLNGDWIEARREGDTIVISENESKKPKFDKNSKGHHLDLTAKISVPRGIDLETKVMAGSLDVKGDYGQLQGKVDAGEVHASEVSVDQSVKLKVGAGEIHANFTRSPREASELEVGVGEIGLDLKGDATLNVEVGIGNVEGGPKSKGDDDEGLGNKQKVTLGNGGTTIHVKVGAGNVSIGQGKSAKSTKKHGDLSFNFDGNGIGDHDIDFDFDKDLGKDIQREIEESMKQVDVEVKRALEQAQKEIERAKKESGHEIDDKDLSPEARAIAQDAMKVAQRAMELAQKELQKALKKGWKEHKNESF